MGPFQALMGTVGRSNTSETPHRYYWILGMESWSVKEVMIALLAKESIELYPRSMVFEELVKLIFVRLDNFSKQSENLFLFK